MLRWIGKGSEHVPSWSGPSVISSSTLPAYWVLWMCWKMSEHIQSVISCTTVTQYLEIILSRSKDDKNLGREYLIGTSWVQVFFAALLPSSGHWDTLPKGVAWSWKGNWIKKKNKKNCVCVCVVQHDSLFRPILGCSLKFSVNLSPPSKFAHASMLRLY